MIRYFCVSDVHSFYDQLMEALNNKNFEISNKNHKLIICGDAFDRGDFSLKVFEFMKKLQSEDRLIYIRGNHEDLLLDCIDELARTGYASGHHYHNQTVKTLSHFIDEDDFWVYSTHIPTNIIEKITKNTKNLREFIQKNSRNYFILGDKIFVHSWIPCISEDNAFYHSNKKYKCINPIWNKNPKELKDSTLENYIDSWESARWGNPFLMWKNKLYPEGKCVVFGHWHCSYGHSHIDMKTKEWPQKNHNNWWDAFKPWVKENAIGIDACCAYSGFINCLVFDENGNLLEI